MVYYMKSVRVLKRRWGKGFFCVLLSLVAIFMSCGKKQEITIAVCGSEKIISTLKSAAGAYEKDRSVRVCFLETTSMAGLDSLIEGRSDIAATALRIPGEISVKAKIKNKKFAETIIGYDVIVPIVHASNPLNNLFLGQLADIYNGLIDDWKDVELKPGRIVVVDREKSSAIRRLMTERFFYSEEEELKCVVKSSDEEVAAAVASEPDAIGYISRTALVDGVKIVTINRISPTDDNVLKKYYKLYRELYLYYDESDSREVIREFVDFMRGTEGQKILHQAEIIPAGFFNQR
jgi:phosphate transport system substrate-binding protein